MIPSPALSWTDPPDNGWPILDVDTVDCAPAAALVALWRSLAGADGAPPSRAELGPERLKPWLGCISVYEPVDAEGSDFRCRLDGSGIVDLTGEDWTGRTANWVDERFRLGLCRDLRAAWRAEAPHAHRIAVFQKTYIPACRLLLPVSTKGDGRQVLLALFAQCSGCACRFET